MSLRKLRAVKPAAKPVAPVTITQVKLKTTNLKTGEVTTHGPFDSEMLKGWMAKNAGGTILSYQAVAL